MPYGALYAFAKNIRWIIAVGVTISEKTPNIAPIIYSEAIDRLNPTENSTTEISKIERMAIQIENLI